ncbi:hypothetical protein [Afifella pfennigii]|uniref:hypothetical protein n=1 Tax=Afifella pfennigii TaxID=209897 RepID=UPI00047896EB|nr:hypothetical protein [Afifella pfennigii]
MFKNRKRVLAALPLLALMAYPLSGGSAGAETLTSVSQIAGIPLAAVTSQGGPDAGVLARRGSRSLVVQRGNNNQAGSAIVSSPGSVSAQFQYGNGNTSAVGVFGGARNAVLDVQNGNGLVSNVLLLGSVGSAVISAPSARDSRPVAVIGGRGVIVIRK